MTNYNLKDQDGVYSNLMKDATLLKVKTKDDEIKELKYKAEKHDYENILKSLKIDNEFYKKKFKSLSKQKIYISVLEVLAGASGFAVGTALSVTGVGASIGVPIAGVSSFLVSVAVLLTNEYMSKMQTRYTKLRDHISMITLLYEKTLKNSMIDKVIDEKESDELKKIYNHYMDKKDEIMKNTKFSVEEVFGTLDLSKNISGEQIEKLNAFLSKLM